MATAGPCPRRTRCDPWRQPRSPRPTRAGSTPASWASPCPCRAADLFQADLAALGCAQVGRLDQPLVDHRVLPIRRRWPAAHDPSEKLLELESEWIAKLEIYRTPVRQRLGLHLAGVETEQGRLGLLLGAQRVEAEQQTAILAIDLKLGDLL